MANTTTRQTQKQRADRTFLMLATHLLTQPSLQFAGVPVMVGDGQLSFLLTILPWSSPCRAGTHPPVPMDRHLVPGARCCAPCCCCPASCHEASVLQLLQLVCYLPKTTVFNNIYYPPQIYLFIILLQGSQFVKYCKFTTKLNKKFIFEKLAIRFKLTHLVNLHIILSLSKIEPKVNFNYIVYQHICVSYNMTSYMWECS